jgi:hypothetical protein
MIVLHKYARVQQVLVPQFLIASGFDRPGWLPTKKSQGLIIITSSFDHHKHLFCDGRCTMMRRDLWTIFRMQLPQSEAVPSFG